MIEDRLAVSASGEDSARQFKVDVRNGDSLGLTTRAIEKQIAKLREKVACVVSAPPGEDAGKRLRRVTRNSVKKEKNFENYRNVDTRRSESQNHHHV